MFASYMLNSWIAASIVAVTAGVIGFFVVLRGDSFAAHALPLGTFPGAAAAGLLGVNPFYGLVVFSGLGVIGISQIGRQERHGVAVALSLVFLLGLGTLFLSLSGQYAQSAYALLFGEVLGISDAQIAPAAIAGAITIAGVLLLFRPLLLSAVSPELCATQGVSAGRMELLFLSLLALATAMALPVVGALLVFSLMTGPAAAARALSNKPLVAMLLSTGMALVTVWAAIALSYLTNWPVGFFVGAAGLVLYALGRVMNLKVWDDFFDEPGIDFPERDQPEAQEREPF
jgi:zinc/manganese transport system permease protein